MLNIESWVRKPRPVEVVLVTRKNMAEVAEWCDGKIDDGGRTPFIVIGTHRPMNTRQTRAYLGDYVLKFSDSYKIYNPKAFLEEFERAPVVQYDLSYPPD